MQVWRMLSIVTVSLLIAASLLLASPHRLIEKQETPVHAPVISKEQETPRVQTALPDTAMQQAQARIQELETQRSDLLLDMKKRLGYLFAGYLVIWIVLFGYMLNLARRQKRLAQELETLKQISQQGR